jgi:hypothetical protein
MKRMPILTSGRLLVQRGIISAPLDDDGSDWAELAIVEVDDQDASFRGVLLGQRASRLPRDR